MSTDPYAELITTVVLAMIVALLGVILWVLFRKYVLGTSEAAPGAKQLADNRPLEAPQETEARRISSTVTARDGNQGSYERRLSGTGNQGTKQEAVAMPESVLAGADAAQMPAGHHPDTLDESKRKKRAPTEAIQHDVTRGTKSSSHECLEPEGPAKVVEGQDADVRTRSQSAREARKRRGAENKKQSIPPGEGTMKPQLPSTTSAPAAPGTGGQVTNPTDQASQEHSKSKESRHRKKHRRSSAAGSTGVSQAVITTSDISSATSKRKPRPIHDSAFKTSTGITPDKSSPADSEEPQAAKQKPVRPQRRPSTWFKGWPNSNTSSAYSTLTGGTIIVQNDAWFENVCTGSWDPCALGVTQVASKPGTFFPTSTDQDDSSLSYKSPRPPTSKTAGQDVFGIEQLSTDDNAMRQCPELSQ